MANQENVAMPRDSVIFTYTYETLQRLTGLEIDTLRQHRTRGKFDAEDLWSVVVYCARHGLPELRKELVENALSITEDTPKKPKGRTSKRR